MDETRSYKTLSELQKLIGESLKRDFNDQFWVVAEIAELKINYAGHCYLELVEKEVKSEEISARIRGIIWSRQARMLLPYFETTTTTPLGEGMKILVKTSLEYHSLYGISVIITDIDPAYTMGEMAVKRATVLRKLEEEGVIGMNRELLFPLFPKRIAVVSSKTAAGYGDFVSQLQNNQFGYNFSITLFPATMQGRETSGSVTAALNAIYDQLDNFDIAAIVRGGGSQSDLSWFDDYDIAFMITQFPIPVLTGIGHDRDVSVADIVSFSSLKTPTAVADYILGKTAETENYLDYTGKRISERAQLIIGQAFTGMERVFDRLERCATESVQRERVAIGKTAIKIPSAARLKLQGYSVSTDNLKLRLPVALKRFISTLREKTDEFSIRHRELSFSFITRKSDKISIIERSVNHLSPDSVLARGYSITMIDGKSVHDVKSVKKGNKVTTIVRNGSFDSEVFDIK